MLNTCDILLCKTILKLFELVSKPNQFLSKLSQLKMPKYWESLSTDYGTSCIWMANVIWMFWISGPLGYQGSKAAMKVISEADVVLALGTRLGPFGSLPQYEFDYWPKTAKIIQVNFILWLWVILIVSAQTYFWKL